MGFRNRIKVFVDWAWNYLTYDRGSRILREVDRQVVEREVGNDVDRSGRRWSRAATTIRTASSQESPVPAAAPLRARDLTVTRGPLTVLDGVDLVVAAGRAHRRRRSQRRRQVDAAAGARRARARSSAAGSSARRRRPPSATCPRSRRARTRRSPTFLARRTGVTDADAELDAATAALAAGAAGADDRYAIALERWLALGGADLDARIGQVWADLGLAGRLLDQPTASLSGGEAARAGLAALLLARFDVFLLDEPTNDLDLAGLDRLERWITALPAAVVLVSHDRTFLARTVTDVVELDEFTHRATRFGGGWQAYLDEREAARRARVGALRGVRHQAQGRWPGGPSASGSGRRRACPRRRRPTSRTRTSGRSRSTRPSSSPAGRPARSGRWSAWTPSTSRASRGSCGCPSASPGRSGDVVARLDGVVVERGDFTLGPIDLLVGDRRAHRPRRRQRLGQDDAARRHARARRARRRARRTLGPSVVVGEVEQARDRLAGLDVAAAGVPGRDRAWTPPTSARCSPSSASSPTTSTRPAATLSPGERTRASLALLMANGANVLVLDEPTNHLDLPAIEQLEAALDGFDGTVLLVTHDRSLLERVRLTRRIELAGGHVVADAVV